MATDVRSEIASLPAARARRAPSGPCVADDARHLDNAGFAAAVDRAAVLLTELGVGAGDTVAVMLPNCAELVTSMFAAWRLGAALTPVNPVLTDDEVLYQLRDSACVALVADDRGARLAKAADAAFLPSDALFSREVAPAPRAAGNGGGLPSAPRAEDFALIIYTSGTTGRPKGVLLDHANLSAMTTSLIDALALGPGDTSLVVLPLFHANGLVVSVLSALRAGGDVVIAGRFDPTTFWDVVEARRPTYLSAVPTIYARLEAQPPRSVDTSSLRFVICGAAPMPADLIGRFEARFGVPIIEGYGLSEGTVASTLNPLSGPRKPGTVGVALPGQHVATMAADGTLLPRGSRGEVIIRGANVMRGYLGRPDATAAVLRDGWLHTGDVGYLDEDGYLVLVDRLKDMIIRGGENIYPKEIEDVLYLHPAVLEAAVVGRRDAILGEVPVAFVALRPGVSVDAAELTEHCRARLARYKLPQEIRLLPELPKNSVGKLVKGFLPRR